ncbi:hypothetical protein FNV43_RR18512 [Rhamnella rubrinervis]|uniref:non-specific serine/threonine protein kinase n=1 Tax=Rhamnella rubrinervis TaxID=2594499 RepID=A0A8K0GVR6_9ROSA|nr:hypothetical protein FNV43_RR18512 [Rhamnella rubrinervis]
MASIVVLFLASESSLQLNKRESNIIPGSSLTPIANSWLSNSGLYAFGFYKQGNGYAVGIFLAGTPKRLSPGLQSETAIQFQNSTLLFTNDGRLVLQSSTQRQDYKHRDPLRLASSASMLDSCRSIPFAKSTKEAIYVVRIDSDGIFRVYSYTSGTWSIEWPSSLNRCDPMGICGVNSFCVPNGGQADCICLPGSKIVNEVTAGCEKISDADGCGNNQSFTYAIQELQNTTWDHSPYSIMTLSEKKIVKKLVVAVKRLDKVLRDGEIEFQTEMKVIGKTHHRNLVRLIGFCVDGPNRLLVYEYMGNGSLADTLFAPKTPPPWDKRMQIAHNIARGILYLHVDCMSKIIHCDIKPQNILMDENCCAKISDFGLAKLLQPDQTRTFTCIRGTRLCCTRVASETADNSESRCLHLRNCTTQPPCPYSSGLGAVALAHGDTLPFPDFEAASKLFPQRDFSFQQLGVEFKRVKCAVKRFVFDAVKIEALKATAASTIVKQPSRVEAVTALIWRCTMSASSARRTSNSVLTHSGNLRNKVEPHLSDKSFGNLA